MDAIKAQIEKLVAEKNLSALIDLITVVLAKIFGTVAEEEGFEIEY